MKRKVKPGTLRFRILEVCTAAPAGLTMPEIYAAIPDIKSTAVAVKIAECVQCGQLFKAGVMRRMRYFTDFDKAMKHAAEVIVGDKQRRIELKRAANKRIAERRKLERAEKRKHLEALEQQQQAKPAKPLKVVKLKAAPAPKPAKEPKAPKLTTPKHTSPPIPIARKKTDIERRIPAHHHFAKQVTVTWPEHVKVQVLPHGEDTRLKFVPPPGWKGEITKDRLKESREALKGKAQ